MDPDEQRGLIVRPRAVLFDVWKRLNCNHSQLS